ncbi:hypothetical protein M5K25_012492 [Dendrobium thyrsiflorum]|uniref:Uncharacterized protein n=1 Tax=Dendrobium thyrsiflorum TaxID=117978 RepID=A0ABD0UXN3_DENTH
MVPLHSRAVLVNRLKFEWISGRSRLFPLPRSKDVTLVAGSSSKNTPKMAPRDRAKRAQKGAEGQKPLTSKIERVTEAIERVTEERTESYSERKG